MGRSPSNTARRGLNPFHQQSEKLQNGLDLATCALVFGETYNMLQQSLRATERPNFEVLTRARNTCPQCFPVLESSCRLSKSGDDVYKPFGVDITPHPLRLLPPPLCGLSYRPHANQTTEKHDNSSWSPMTAEEFRSSQLRRLHRRVGRVRRLLYPGLSEALKANLGRAGAAGAWGGGGPTTSPPPPPDGHVRRYVLAATANAVFFSVVWVWVRLCDACRPVILCSANSRPLALFIPVAWETRFCEETSGESSALDPLLLYDTSAVWWSNTSNKYRSSEQYPAPSPSHTCFFRPA